MLLIVKQTVIYNYVLTRTYSTHVRIVTKIRHFIFALPAQALIIIIIVVVTIVIICHLLAHLRQGDDT